MSLEIEVSEDKRQSAWQCQEGKCNREKKSLGRCFFLPEMALRSLKTARGSERGDRSEQVACQAADLALEVTEDALREASVYLRRCDSDRCATERALRRSRTADSASWGHQVLGGNDQGGQRGIEALAASTKNREEEWAAWWMLSSSKSREGRCSAI